MESSEETRTECPNFEKLSAWFDREGSLTPEQREHIRTCPACIRRLEDYNGIRNGVQDNINGACNPDVVMERILSQTRSMIRSQKIDAEKVNRTARFRKRFVWGVRIALLLILGGAFVFLFLRDRSAGKAESSARRTTAVSTHFGASPYAEFHMPRKIVTSQTANAFSSSGSILEIQLSPGIFCVFDGKDRFQLHPPAFIPLTQEQFWSCNSFKQEDLIKHLESVAKASGTEHCRAAAMADDLVVCEFRGSARQLAVTVKQLASLGFVQKVSAVPAPDQNFFTPTGEYEVFCRFYVQTASDAGHIIPVSVK